MDDSNRSRARTPRRIASLGAIALLVASVEHGQLLLLRITDWGAIYGG